MILGGMALAFSRVIDNSVISLENIYRHLEMGALPMVAAEEGGAEVSLAVLAATLVDVVDFFPVVFLYGVSKFLFPRWLWRSALSLLASFVVAMTVIPLFCSRFLKAFRTLTGERGSRSTRHAERGFNAWFNRRFNKVLDVYERWVRRALLRPALTVAALMLLFVASLGIYPFLGARSSRRPTPGSSPSISKCPPEPASKSTEQYVAKMEDLIRRT